jgi:uncharacterized protein (DUF362 family)
MYESIVKLIRKANNNLFNVNIIQIQGFRIISVSHSIINIDFIVKLLKLKIHDYGSVNAARKI